MIRVFVDGASRPNPGPSAAGLLVRDGDRDVHTASVLIGHASNNEAEYRAALLGLAWLHDNGYGETPVELLSDSTAVVNGLSGYDHANQKLVRLALEGRVLLQALQCTVRWIPGDDNPAHEFASAPFRGGKSRRRPAPRQDDRRPRPHRRLPAVDPARMERARGLAVARLGRDLFEVASSTGGKTYLVEYQGRKKGWRCKCPDATYRRVKCKHAYAAEFLKEGLDQPQLEIEPDEPHGDICDYEPFRERGVFQQGPYGEYVNFFLLLQSLTPDDRAVIEDRLRQNYASLRELKRHGLDYQYFTRDVERLALQDRELARLLDTYAEAELLLSKLPDALAYGYHVEPEEEAMFRRYVALLRDPALVSPPKVRPQPAQDCHYQEKTTDDGEPDAVPPGMAIIQTKAVGVTQEGRQEIIAGLKVGDLLRLVREPANPYDPTAIRLDTETEQTIGYLPRDLAAKLAGQLDRLGSDAWSGCVTALTGGTPGKPTRGLNIELKAKPGVVNDP